MGRAHQVGLEPRKFALARLGKTPDQGLGNQEPEHRIAQELELLVVVQRENWRPGGIRWRANCG